MGFDLDGLKKEVLEIIDDALSDCIEGYVETHLGYQPYRIKCSECGGDIDFTASVDNFLDIDIDIEPCKCILEE